jgi:predicted helicase
MSHSTLIKATNKAITEYYRTLQETAAQGADHEMAVRRAFRELLAATSRLHDWTIIEEKTHATELLGNVRPDATFYKTGARRGYWEAKDTADNLDAEIKKKKAKGYSLVNTIFEDTRTAVLYQNKQEILRIDLKDPEALSSLLNQFYAHTEPDFEFWDEAVEDFKDRVPELAKGLVGIIESAHKSNKKFQKAFLDFFTLCQTALNPNIAQAAVDEMLIQHLLTERLFRTIFNAADFTQRNVIAAEVEKVITALASGSFSREEYLKSLDRFYRAIEMAAKHLDWSEKQHFLNTIYERFFQGYSVKTADTMGIVYTPQPIVDFMCASVAEVLKKEFNKELGDPDVFILDPCTGTANFVVNLLRRIPPKKLTQAYRNNLFANEIMLMPYYIAALNIEHAYYELAGKYEPFEGLCFVDTLDLAEHKQNGFDFFVQKNTERVERQKKSPITVVIGNPPYNVGQMVHNEQNKNRPYDKIDGRISSTYAAASTATSVSKLNDPYVKFIRWATDRLGTRDGIVCFVTNNSFVEQIAFDGMRKHLVQDFTAIYHLDLKGNVRQNPTLSGTQYNVFGIQLGVGITILVRRQKKPWSMAKGRPTDHAKLINYAELQTDMRRADKLRAVHELASSTKIKWKKLRPDDRNTWLVPENAEDFAEFLPIASRAARAASNGSASTIFRDYTLGVATHRDAVVYDFSETTLEKRVIAFIERYNTEIDRWKRTPKDADLDTFVSYEHITWDRDLKNDLKRLRYVTFRRDHLRIAAYRPFCSQNLYFDRILNAEVYGFPSVSPKAQCHKENQLIVCSDIAHRSPGFSTLMVRGIADLHLCATLDGHQCFPFYIYDEDGTNRRENITDWALAQFRSNYHDDRISKWDIFHYVYALLHHPAYRTKFADNLKRELPRIPFAPPYIAPGLPGETARPRKGAASTKPKPKDQILGSSSVSSKLCTKDSALSTSPSPSSAFHAFARAGKQLADLHLNYESAKLFPLKEIIEKGAPRSPRVASKMKLSKDKSQLVVNPSLTLAGIPPETFAYKLGNRSALDWIIDQYQLYTDPRTHITSDPNAWADEHDDPEYIVNLIARIITVSLETTKIVHSLPKDFAGPA